jgi:hypothetical protein
MVASEFNFTGLIAQVVYIDRQKSSIFIVFQPSTPKKDAPAQASREKAPAKSRFPIMER